MHDLYHAQFIAKEIKTGHQLFKNLIRKEKHLAQLQREGEKKSRSKQATGMAKKLKAGLYIIKHTPTQCDLWKCVQGSNVQEGVEGLRGKRKTLAVGNSLLMKPITTPL